MKLFYLLLVLVFSGVSLFSQSITNVKFRQEGSKIEITYNLQSEMAMEIEVFCSTDGGKTFGEALKSVSGDAGSGIQAGSNKKIIWDVLKDNDMLYSEQIAFKVTGSVNYVGEMIYVEGGTFQMGCTSEQNNCGDDEKAHSVTLSSFYIGKYEVTQKQWRDIMEANPSKFNDCDNCPVEQVSWNDIQDFLQRLNAKTGKKYILPTEAQWEYAARGGNKRKGYLYSGSNNIDDVAWYSSNSGSKTHPVGQKKSNELNIYDMTGNVWEWCSDWYDEKYYKNSPANNPQGVNSGSYRVYRGGSWDLEARYCRVAIRDLNYPDYRFSIGLRLAFVP
ncbi:MAG: formylglycine-generating enzyme family protein [Bacteroidetes bacterium]|nr:formylglycine-generating enzyme family protein [Bacteroidota bacterium]